MPLVDDIRNALGNLVTLTITTSVTEGDQAAKDMVTTIDLLQGDITTVIPQEFVDGGPYASLRAFHLEREQQGGEIVRSNVEALRSLLGLAHEAGPAVE